jgi:DNA-binding NtrC family response regulator
MCGCAHCAQFTLVKPAASDPHRGAGSASDRPGRSVVLILSADPVASALLGALIETLGYLVRFHRPSRTADEAMRRERPSIAMLDCEDPTLMNDELLGRARMRGISVIVFGSRDALARVRELAAQHDLHELLMPGDLDAVDDAIRQAVGRLC